MTDEVPMLQKAVQDVMNHAPLHPKGVDAYASMTEQEFRKATSDEIWTILNLLEVIAVGIDALALRVDML